MPFYWNPKNLIILYPLANPFTQHWNLPGKFLKHQSLFLKSKFQSMTTAYLPVCTTNLQIPTVICYIHPLVLPLSETPSCSLNFLVFDVYVVMIPISPTNQRKSAFSSRNVAILILLSTRLNTALKKLIDSQHCKCHRRKRIREFHLRSLIIHITSQPKTSFKRTLNYSKMTMK